MSVKCIVIKHAGVYILHIDTYTSIYTFIYLESIVPHSAYGLDSAHHLNSSTFIVTIWSHALFCFIFFSILLFSPLFCFMSLLFLSYLLVFFYLCLYYHLILHELIGTYRNEDDRYDRSEQGTRGLTVPLAMINHQYAIPMLVGGMYICMHECIYLCMYVCMYVCMYGHV